MNAWYEKSYVERDQLQKWSEELKKKGKRIVTTNGSFDLLHAGHLHTLFEAKTLGDVLIVLLNTDASIQGYKGPLRPIIELKYRLRMIAALKCVDFVAAFDEPDPREVLKIIGPNIHVNSAEYGLDCIEKSVVEAGGGRVHLVEKIDGLSTSQVIGKIEACITLQQ